MQPDPKKLLDALNLSTPLIGYYDAPEKDSFEPFTAPQQCVFSCFQDWMHGKSTCLSERSVREIQCPGAGYWNCSIESVPREHVAYFLAVEEGLKASQELMCQWLTDQKTYKKENAFVVIGPLRMDQYEFLKTITFYVNPDQLSMLITGAEYHIASESRHFITAKYGTGCGQLAAAFDDFDSPKALIGGTDIAMRPFLPSGTLAFTVTKPMFELLCSLEEESFLCKSFWKNVQQARNQSEIIS